MSTEDKHSAKLKLSVNKTTKNNEKRKPSRENVEESRASIIVYRDSAYNTNNTFAQESQAGDYQSELVLLWHSKLEDKVSGVIE